MAKATSINSILFEDVCKVMKEISNEKVAKEKEKSLVNFLHEVKINAAQSDDKKDSNLFPLMRLFLPDFERERSYNIKELRLGQILQKLLVIPKNSGDGRKLLEFRSVPNTKIGSDFPSVAYYVLKNRFCNNTGNLTIEDINNTLDKIAFAEAGNKSFAIDESFHYILRNTTPAQLTWFLRILLKDLKLGIGKTKILAALHPDAPEYYESCNSLQKVCEEIDEGNTRPLELGIRIFSAISPMLSERLDVTNLDRLMDGNVTYQIENKFDGERFQMHMKDGIFEYYSRKGFSYSEHYGRSYDAEGLLTPDLKDCFSPGVVSFILDGEMMGWHKLYECFGSKGMAFDIKKTTSTSKFRPCFCAFDVLYYNGTALVGPRDKGGLPLKERMAILDSIFNEIKGVIHKSHRRMVQDKSEVKEALNKAISEQQEGLILKDVNSMYIPNRRNVGWYKIKPEYTEGAMVDLDLVIIGADFAENKKQGLAKSFLVACVDCLPDGVHRWVLVGRAATGLSFEERERLCSILQPHWKRTKYERPPDCLSFNKEKPDLWILPEYSVVLTVRATELIRSKDFGTSHTLRFPRITQIREDKPVGDILTLDGFNRLVQDKGPVVKLTTSEITEDQHRVSSKAPRKRKATPLLIAEVFRHQPTDVEVVSQALKGRKICILSDDEDCKKDVLERLVVSHGGVVVQNTASDTWCCIAGRPTIRLKNALASKQVDILPTSWLRGLEPSMEPVPKPSPAVMVAVSRRTLVETARFYDEFGDSYTEDADEDSLRRCFDKMDREPGSKIYLTTEEIVELEGELYPEGNPYPCI